MVGECSVLARIDLDLDAMFGLPRQIRFVEFAVAISKSPPCSRRLTIRRWLQPCYKGTATLLTTALGPLHPCLVTLRLHHSLRSPASMGTAVMTFVALPPQAGDCRLWWQPP